MSTDDEKSNKKEESKLQRNVKLVENWYQSYYMWNTCYFYSSCMQSRPPICQSPHLVFRSTYILNNNNGNSNANNARHRSSARQQNARDERTAAAAAAHLRVYKVPSLGRRFCAELLDAFYIQIIKIIIAIALLNYTDIL